MEKTAVDILKILNKNDFKSYFVGGWVRDKYLNRNSSDIDIATSATPDEIIDIFKKHEDIIVVPTGIKHGTITLIKNGHPVECTTFRRDISTDGRNATVEFTKSIEEDLSRRDFALNALALCPIEDKIIDPFNGLRDIKNKMIKAVGNPADRFREDYLRLFRALRFSATLDFTISDITWDDLCQVATDGFTDKLSIERVRDELNKCFKQADKPSDMLDNMYESGLLKLYLPELFNCHDFKQNKYHKYDVYLHTLYALDAVPAEFPLIRWAALFHDLGKPQSCQNYGLPEASFHNHEFYSTEICINIMKRFKFSNDEIAYISNLVKHHMWKYDTKMKDSVIRKLVTKVGLENIESLIILKYADRRGNGKRPAEDLSIDSTGLKQRLLKMSEKERIFKITDLVITGKDVMDALNITSGPRVGIILRKMYDLVVEFPEKNNKEYLLNFATHEFIEI